MKFRIRNPGEVYQKRLKHLRDSVRMNTGANLGYTETCLKNKEELNREKKLTRLAQVVRLWGLKVRLVRKLTDSKKREDDKEIMLDLRHIKQRTNPRQWWCRQAGVWVQGQSSLLNEFTPPKWPLTVSSVLRRPHVSFQPLWAPGTHVVHLHTQWQNMHRSAEHEITDTGG